MSFDRLEYALASGGLTLPDSGGIALVGYPPSPVCPVSADQRKIVTNFAPDFVGWERLGAPVTAELDGPYTASIIRLPRARDLAETRIARAEAATPGGLVVVDGAKTDGIETIAKALRARGVLSGMISKAHGKVLWFSADAHLTDWIRAPMARNAQGDMTAPGVFSADGADPASVALASALPQIIKGHVADFGAGWGWLGRKVLEHASVATVHLVEADKSALDCAMANIDDARAQFHWADATSWMSPALLDAVVMNPPFHVNRKADPALGQAFIRSAARQLKPQGVLWMVANRHLPYESTLTSVFQDVREVQGTGAFKIFHAARPARTRR